MSTLNGETIEELFWENTLDFHHTSGLDDLPSIEVLVGESVVIVSETWATEEGWFLDTETTVMERFNEGQVQEADFEPPVSEKDLVEKIMRLGGIDE